MASLQVHDFLSTAPGEVDDDMWEMWPWRQLGQWEHCDDAAAGCEKSFSSLLLGFEQAIRRADDEQDALRELTQKSRGCLAARFVSAMRDECT